MIKIYKYIILYVEIYKYIIYTEVVLVKKTPKFILVFVNSYFFFTSTEISKLGIIKFL